jgi:hypothetical protein
VLFQNFLKNPLDSSCIPLNISKNPEVSSHHLSIHVQFHGEFGRVTGGGAKTGCRLKRFWHWQSGSGSTITGQKKSLPVLRMTGDFSRKWYNPFLVSGTPPDPDGTGQNGSTTREQLKIRKKK